MKKLIRIAVFLALAGSFAHPVFADSSSQTFRVSATIPPQLELSSAPAKVRVREPRSEDLLIRGNAFGIGKQTNVGRNVAQSIHWRDTNGIRTQVFTLVVL